MLRRRPDLEAARRTQERREREQLAGKLTALVPTLSSLRLEIDEKLEDAAVSGARHIRHIVVEHAPALFEIPCSAPDCRGGGHDLTETVLEALQASRAQFDGEDVCLGRVGSRQCGRVLCFSGYAEFRDPAR